MIKNMLKLLQIRANKVHIDQVLLKDSHIKPLIKFSK